MINTTGYAALLTPDLKRVYVETGKERESEYDKIVNVEEMDWIGETDRQISGLGTMPSKPEGEQFTLDQPILGGTKAYTPIARGLAVEITFEMVDDELYGVMETLIAGLRRASNNRLEVDGHAVLNRAFSTSYAGFTAGEALCSVTHTLLDGSTTSNRPSNDIEFSVTGLQNALIRYHNMLDDRGLPRVMHPVMVVVAPENLWTAREILGSGGKPYTADNEINALVPEELSYMIDHYLTTTTYWFLLAARGEHDLNMRMKNAPTFDMFDDRRTKTAVATSYQRHSESQFGSFRGIDGSTGA